MGDRQRRGYGGAAGERRARAYGEGRRRPRRAALVGDPHEACLASANFALHAKRGGNMAACGCHMLGGLFALPPHGPAAGPSGTPSATGGARGAPASVARTLRARGSDWSDQSASRVHIGDGAGVAGRRPRIWMEPRQASRPPAPWKLPCAYPAARGNREAGGKRLGPCGASSGA